MKDLVVVGAGPCGLAVGVAAREAGLDCTLFDKGPLAAAIERYPIGMRFFSSADRLEIGDVPFVASGEKPTRAEALHYYRRVAQHFELDVRQYEMVVALAPAEGHFELRTRSLSGGERSYEARYAVVSTGNFDLPNLLDVPGEELSKVTHYFREPHRYYDQDVLVVGGGNSAVESALAVRRVGGRVTLVHQFEDFDEGVKPWILPDIRNRVAEGSITALWRHVVRSIESESVTLGAVDSEAEVSIRNDWVLAMTGYRPDYSLLTSAGAELNPDGVLHFDPETYQTSVPGLFVAGVVTAGGESGSVFIENGREHGAAIVAHLETLSR